MLPELVKQYHRQRLICLATLAFYTTACFSTLWGRSIKNFPVGDVFLALSLLALTIPLYGAVGRDIKEKTYIKSYVLPYRELTILLLVVFNVGVNGVYLFESEGYAAKEYQKRGYEVARLQGNTMRELEPFLLKNPLGRGDGSGFTLGGGGSKAFVLNSSMVWQIPDMHIYSSVGNKNIIEFWRKMEHYSSSLAFQVSVTNRCTIVDTLLSGVYQVETAKKASYVPYGYSRIKSTKRGNNIYKNEYALPWGYTYDKAISYETLESLNGLARQEAMLQAVALDKEDAFKAGRESLSFDARRLPYTTQFTNCEWKDGRLNVKRPNATVTLNFMMPCKVEGYVRLQGFDIKDSGREGLMFFVKCGDVEKFAVAVSSLFMLYDGRENFLVNLGYSAKDRHSATITFPRPGTFKLKDIELYALPMTNYPARVNALRAEPLKNIQWGTNKLSGSVDLSKDKILCVSVPYSKGWHAAVDGQEAKILRGNYMFMALPLKAGHHDIVFSYCPPGLKLGLILTVLSWAFFIAMLVRDKRKVGRE